MSSSVKSVTNGSKPDVGAVAHTTTPAVRGTGLPDHRSRVKCRPHSADAAECGRLLGARKLVRRPEWQGSTVR